MSGIASAYPLRDLFDAAVRQYGIKLTCGKCGRVTIHDPHALWNLFNRRGWPDRFKDVQKRCVCVMCLHRRGIKVRFPKLELVHEEATDNSLPMPAADEWKRALRRRR